MLASSEALADASLLPPLAEVSFPAVPLVSDVSAPALRLVSASVALERPPGVALTTTSATSPPGVGELDAPPPPPATFVSVPVAPSISEVAVPAPRPVSAPVAPETPLDAPGTTNSDTDPAGVTGTDAPAPAKFVSVPVVEEPEGRPLITRSEMMLAGVPKAAARLLPSRAVNPAGAPPPRAPELPGRTVNPAGAPWLAAVERVFPMPVVAAAVAARIRLSVRVL